MHAEVTIGNSMVMLGEATEQWRPMPAKIALYVEHADAWYKRALEAGASSVKEPSDQFLWRPQRRRTRFCGQPLVDPYAHRRCVAGRDQEARGIVDEAAKEKPHTKGPNAHFHKTMSESFFILAGTVRLFNGERWIDARAGDFLYVPEGGIHGFHNESDEPASMLLLFAPGAPREGYFEALAEKAAGRRFSDEEWKDICLRHDNYFI